MKRILPVLALTLLCTALLPAASVVLTLDSMPPVINGTPVGFVPAHVDGIPTNIYLSVVCDDEVRSTNIGQPFAVNISYLAPPMPVLEFARFKDPNNMDASVQKYKQAALLLYSMPSNPAEGSPEALFLRATQYALWNLMNPAQVNIATYPLAQARLQWSFDALANHSGNYSQYFQAVRIYTPTAGYDSNQEFMGAVPEPATLMLVGSVLIGLPLALRRRRKRS